MKKRFHAVLLMMLAGWINRQQQEMMEYLMAENKILREKLGKRCAEWHRHPIKFHPFE